VLGELVEPAGGRGGRGRLVLTRRGRLLANEVAIRLVAQVGRDSAGGAVRERI
jgi:hypothetical protein